MTSETDTRYFDEEFTAQTITITPPEKCKYLRNVYSILRVSVDLENFFYEKRNLHTLPILFFKNVFLLKFFWFTKVRTHFLPAKKQHHILQVCGCSVSPKWCSCNGRMHTSGLRTHWHSMIEPEFTFCLLKLFSWVPIPTLIKMNEETLRNIHGMSSATAYLTWVTVWYMLFIWHCFISMLQNYTDRTSQHLCCMLNIML